MIFPRITVIEDALMGQPADHADFNLAVLRNVTVEGIEPYLRYEGMKDRLRLQLQWGSYDNILQEASGLGSGVLNEQTQAVLVCLWLPAFSEILSFTFASVNSEYIEAELARVRDYCSATLHALRERSVAPIYWFGFEPPAWPSYGILDATSRNSQRAAIAALNAFLAGELEQAGNAWLVDTGLCFERVGAKDFYDWRYWHMAHAPYGRRALAELAGEVQKHVRAGTGRVRKCLILDCDNTLWGGIVGEDGADGIRIGTEHPGSAYREFQLEVLNLYHRGVILVICSKNNEDDVLEVLRSRTADMVLREEHFAVICVNWQDKATNLRKIAAELNIGLDSIVFADDSDFEINLVRKSLPEVATLQISTAKPYENRLLLVQGGWFDTHALTDGDRVRGKMYRNEVARKNLASTITDIGEYLKSLEMRLTVEAVTDAELDRVVQLCQRTNQFNLTTKRYSRDELATHLPSSASTLLLFRLADRFGDYGIVGFCLAVNEGISARIDTFLISCRALGRGVETIALALCVEKVALKGAKVIIGNYLPTKKNSQVANFYQCHGFTQLEKVENAMQFELHWKSGCITVPSHFSLGAAV